MTTFQTIRANGCGIILTDGDALWLASDFSPSTRDVYGRRLQRDAEGTLTIVPGSYEKLATNLRRHVPPIADAA